MQQQNRENGNSELMSETVNHNEEPYDTCLDSVSGCEFVDFITVFMMAMINESHQNLNEHDLDVMMTASDETSAIQSDGCEMFLQKLAPLYGNIPLERLEALHTIVEQMVITMAVVSASQFTERLAIIKQLLEIWSQGEDVDLMCNEQSETSTTPVTCQDTAPHEMNGVVTSSVQKSRPIAKYKEPVFPRRKPGDPVIPFACSTCNKTFRFYSQLEQHSRHHNGVRPYSCHVCNQSFPLLSNLDKHLTSHSAVKSLMCDACGQCFAHISYLKAHQRTHARHSQLVCHHCQLSFSTASSLHHHISSSHGVVVTAVTESNKDIADKQPNRFTCEKCNKSFSALSALRLHLKSHIDDEAVCSEDASGSLNGISKSTELVHNQVVPLPQQATTHVEPMTEQLTTAVSEGSGPYESFSSDFSLTACSKW